MSKNSQHGLWMASYTTLESYLVILQHAQSIFFLLGLEHKRKKPLFDLFLEAKCQVHGLAWTIGQYVVSDVFEY